MTNVILISSHEILKVERQSAELQNVRAKFLKRIHLTHLLFKILFIRNDWVKITVCFEILKISIQKGSDQEEDWRSILAILWIWNLWTSTSRPNQFWPQKMNDLFWLCLIHLLNPTIINRWWVKVLYHSSAKQHRSKLRNFSE